MHLRCLEILGFKSFAHKTQLDFPHGVAAIVGPNGCGKSNVLDALRWALGEQSAKALRGGEMTDVIFNGTDTRAPLGMAEVTLTFTDCEAQLGTEYHEVSIARRVYRDGRGEYLLNRTPCRLRDIQELFMDTGVGRSAYSIMEQGKIDLILSARPEDRRAVFEEAAGITRYKGQRRDAARKLEAAEANLRRLEDVVGEVRRQAGSLQRQAAKAQRHQALTADLRRLETHLGYEQWTRLERGRTGAEEELARLRIRHELAERALAAGEDKLTRARAALEAAAAALEETRGKAQAHRDILRAAEGRREFNRERAAGSQALLAGYEAELAGAEERLAAQEERLLAAAAEQREAAALLQASQGQLSEQEDAARGARERRAAAEGALQKAECALADTGRALTRQRAELARLTQAQQAEAVRRDVLAEEGARLDAARAAAAARGEDARAQAGAAADALAARRGELRAAELAQAAGQQALQAADAALAAAQRTLAGHRSRLEVLRGLNAAGAGQSAGTQAVLRGLDRPELFKAAVLGVLGSCIEVAEPRFIPAVEALLGPHLQTVLVQNEEAAARLLASLATGNRVGRATLVAVSAGERSKVQGPRSEEGPRSEAQGGEEPSHGLFRAADAVRAAGNAAALVKRLLAGSVIVEDLATAHALRREDPSLNVATLNGELLDRNGCLHGGQSGGEAAHQGVLQRQAQIRALEADAARAGEAADALARARADAAARGQAAAGEMAGARQGWQTAQIQAATLQNQLGSVEREARELGARGDTLRREQEAAARQGDAAGGQAQAVAHRAEELAAAEQQEQDGRARAREAVETLRAQEGELTAALNEQRVRVATEQQRHEGLRRQREPMDARRGELTELIARRRRELADHRARLDRCGAEAGALDAEIAGARASLTRAEARIAERRAEQEEAGAAAEALEARLRGERQALTGWHERRSREELQAAQLRLRQENLREQMSRRYQVDLRAFAPEPAAFLNLYQSLTGQPDAPADWARVEALAQALREKLDGLGAVNADAIAEYDALEQRRQFLETQQADLVAARTELTNIIGQINATTRALFAETFERVRANFQEMHAELFGGGRADLLLANGSDPLECGIEIVARPPGKPLQSITLLSGGEKTLAAVALLFAIYMVKPSPFCVLDEMDAPLDESNIARFLNLLDRFVAQSQFIVITHNKRTISRADALFGVTMEEAGVSKLVTVRMGGKERTTNDE